MPKATENADREERELNTVVNHAIAATEQEVFEEAMGDEELDLDGDTSLEEMGEGLEGDDLEDEEEAEETEPEKVEAKEGDEEPEPEPESEEGEEEAPREDDREERGRFVPRARVKEEADRRRAAESTAAERIAALSAQVETLTQLMARGQQQQQPAAAPPPPPEPEPDMFVEPDKWKDWNRKQARKEAETAVESRLSEFERRQQERNLEGVNESFADAANGQRGYEFNAAYQKLLRLDRQNPENQRLVNRILRSRDPVKDVWSWWEENGGPEFRENALQSLADQYGIELPDDFAPPRRQVNGQRAPQRRPQQPRHETRLPQTMRSLNDARGSGGRSQDGTDPRMLDGSDRSIFEYGASRE